MSVVCDDADMRWNPADQKELEKQGNEGGEKKPNGW
jgi:hypothetical protein